MREISCCLGVEMVASVARLDTVSFPIEKVSKECMDAFEEFPLPLPMREVLVSITAGAGRKREPDSVRETLQIA